MASVSRVRHVQEPKPIPCCKEIPHEREPQSKIVERSHTIFLSVPRVLRTTKSPTHNNTTSHTHSKQRPFEKLVKMYGQGYPQQQGLPQQQQQQQPGFVATQQSALPNQAQMQQGAFGQAPMAGYGGMGAQQYGQQPGMMPQQQQQPGMMQQPQYSQQQPGMQQQQAPMMGGQIMYGQQQPGMQQQQQPVMMGGYTGQQQPQMMGQQQAQAWRPNWMQQYAASTNEYADWFRLADTNKNGSISPAELCVALKAAGEPVDLQTAELMIRMFDKDQNGVVDSNEFGLLFGYLKDLHRSFNSLGGDYVTLEQSRQLLARSSAILQQQGGEGVFQSLFQQVDWNRNGRLDWSEFLKLGALLGTSLSMVERYQYQYPPQQQQQQMGMPMQQQQMMPGGYQQGLAPQQQAMGYGGQHYYQSSSTTTTSFLKPGGGFNYDSLLNNMVPMWLGRQQPVRY